MKESSAYIFVATLSVLALAMMVSNVLEPYGQYTGIALVILASIIAKNNGVNYEVVAKRKAITRIVGYLFIASGILVLGFYSGAWPTQKTASGILIFTGAVLVSVTLKNEKWQKL